MAKGAEKPALRLAQRYAPMMEIKKQRDPCDTLGEGYRPTSVDTVLGNPQVKLLRFPQGDVPARTLAQAPTARDLAGLGVDYNLDLPGDSLHPGCDYMKLSRRLTAAFPNLTYARIAHEPGVHGLALQFWFYWIYNQFTDLHESDWEMIQLDFPVDTVEKALGASPTEAAYAEHAGGTRSSWSGGDLKREGDHPVVYPGAGSHASYFGSQLYLGNGKSGFGCDDTRGPSQRLALTPELIPTRPGYRGRYSWLTFNGIWGQKEPGFYNGPGGPNVHQQWLEPLRWAQGLRTEAPTVPVGNTFGPSATSAFCGGVTAGSKALLFATTHKWVAWLIFLALLAIALVAIRSTSWHKRDPLPLGQRLAGGEVLRAAHSLYRRHLALYRGIGLIFVPLAILAALCSSLILGTDNAHAFGAISGGRGFELAVTAAITILFVGIAFSLLIAAVANSLLEIDRGGKPTPASVYRAALGRIGTLLAIMLAVAFTVGLLSLTVIGIPLAILKGVDWAFATPEAMIRGTGARESLRASTRLVRRRWWPVAGFVFVVLGINVISGAAVGIVLISVTSLPLVAINVVGSIVYVFVVPYCSIAMILERYSLSASPSAPPEPPPTQEG
jgi:hypothetical protein